MEAEQHPVVVLDFGAQYSKLIARRVRESRVFSLIVPYDTPLDALRRLEPGAIIFSGGPASVHAPGAPMPDPGVFELGVPILGICYGVQLFAHMLGGKVRRSDKREYGIAHLARAGAGPLFQSVQPQTQVWMSHGDAITDLPPGFEVLGTTENCPYAAIADPARKLYGVQFHPEVVHTPEGSTILANFLHGVCGLADRWTMGSFVEAEIERLSRIALLRPYLEGKLRDVQQTNAALQAQLGAQALEPANQRRLTNIGTFRAYCEAYVRAHPRIHQQMLLIVRTLEPTAEGVPLELYCFTATTAWVEYEAIQGDIFDHLIAVLPEFGLHLFQSPTGNDIRAGLRPGAPTAMAALP